MAAKKGSQFVVWTILVLLIVGLMGFGATSFGSGQQSIAQVGSVEISADRYVRRLRNDLNGISQQLNREVTLAEAQGLGLDQATLARLISEAAMENETRTLGLSVGDKSVSDEVLEVPAFRGSDGQFNRDTYAMVLDRSGYTVAEFEETVRTDVSSRLLRSAVQAGIKMPDAYVSSLFDYARETRTATFATLTEADLTEPLPLATDEELRAYYEANPEPFTRPETRVLTYVALTPEGLADTIDIADDKVRDAYDTRADLYVTPERRLVERLVYRNEDDARAASERLIAGEVTFDDLVIDRGLTLDDVDMGDVTAADLGEAGPGVFELLEPGVTPPLPTVLGLALFRINAILPRREIAFEDVEADIRTDLQENQAALVIRDQIEDLEDLLAGGATLEEIADETEMELATVEWNDETAEGLTDTIAFRQAAIAAQDGDFPELLETSQGALFALRLDEVLPPALKPLDEVEDQVREALEDTRIADALQAQAENLAAQLREGRTPASLAPAFTTAEDILRTDTTTDLPPAALAAIFEMEASDARVVRDGNTVTLIQLDTITAPDPDEPANVAAIDNVSAANADALSADIAAAFTEAIINQANLSIDTAAINAINAQLY